MFRLLIALPLAASLSGCWFVFIPGSLLAGEKYYCIDPVTQVGGTIKLQDGRTATVKALYGPYDKCREQYGDKFPIKADLAF